MFTSVFRRKKFYPQAKPFMLFFVYKRLQYGASGNNIERKAS